MHLVCEVMPSRKIVIGFAVDIQSWIKRKNPAFWTSAYGYVEQIYMPGCDEIKNNNIPNYYPYKDNFVDQFSSHARINCLHYRLYRSTY